MRDGPAAGLVANGIGFLDDALKVMTSGRQVYDTANNVKNGQSRTDVAQHVLQTGTALTSAYYDWFGMVEKGTTMLLKTPVNLGSMTPITGAAVGGLTAVDGLWDVGQGGKAWRHLNQVEKNLALQGNSSSNYDPTRTIETDENGESESSPASTTTTTTTTTTGASDGNKTDQERMEDILTGAKAAAKVKTAQGSMKFIAGGFSAGVAIAAAVSGPLAPATVAALALTSGAIAAIKYILNREMKNRVHEDVITKEWGINWDIEMENVRAMIYAENPHMRLRDKEVREIILRAHGSKARTRTEAFDAINMKRASYLVDTANGLGNPRYQSIAYGMILAMGVRDRGGSFSEGAKKVVAKKLGV